MICALNIILDLGLYFLALSATQKGRLMIRRNHRGDMPQIHDGAFVDPTAMVCGRVKISEGVFVGPYAVIRADEVDDRGHMEPIVIGEDTNIQDAVIIHSLSGSAVTIGQRTSIAHRAIVHGPCTVKDRCFIGFGSVLFNCLIGDGCIVGHNAVVDGCNIPAKRHVLSTQQIDATIDVATIPQVPTDLSKFSEEVAHTNTRLSHEYKILEDEL